MKIVIDNKRASKRVRQLLTQRVRAGTATLRVYGSKGAWFLGVEGQNGRIRQYSLPYVTFARASVNGFRKFGVKASRLKVAA